MSDDGMFDTHEVTPGIGHNRPPATPTPVTDIETAKRAAAAAGLSIAAWLQRRDPELLNRIVDLEEAVKTLPKLIKTDVDAEKLSDLRAQIAAAIKAVDTLRTTDKKAFEVPANAVHSFWKRQADLLEAATTKAGAVLKAYLVAKQEKIDEANRKAAAAQAKAAADAAAKNRPPPMIAPAPPSPAPVRARGDMGSLSTLQKHWTFENLDRATVDLEALRPYLADVAVEAAIRAFIRADGRTLKGCDIVERPVLNTR